MKLIAGIEGASYFVEKTCLPIQTEKRLEALGMTRGSRITIENRKKQGTMVIKLRGTRFAIGKGISGNVEVRENMP